MATIKLGGFVNEMSGKIGGQVVSNRSQSTTIRNIVHTNKTPTPKQSLQRYRTAVISNRYTQLTSTQRGDWVTTSSNYLYVNSVGDTIQRTGYGTFLFCNQNRLAIGESFLVSPATFVAVGTVAVDIITVTRTVLEVQASLAASTISYMLFANTTTMSFAGANAVNLIRIGLISYSDLQNGIDIIPMIESILGVSATNSLVTFQIVPYHTASGNKFLTQPLQQVLLQ